MNVDWRRLGAIELRGVEPIPEAERRGRIRALLPFWFTVNATPVNAAIGVVPVALGLGLGWSITTIVIGTVIGASISALHAVQGPRLGVPQMVQSRAQFGLLGATLPAIITLVIYIGYAVLGGIVAGAALASMLSISTTLGIIIANVIALVVSIFGYHFIHRCSPITTVAFVIVGIPVTIKLITQLPAHAFSGTTITVAGVATAISIFAVNQLSWSPYCSDYTRYLPHNISGVRAFWYMFLGSIVGAIWSSFIGAVAATVALKAADANLAGDIGHVFSSISALVIILFILGQILLTNTVNFYGAFMVAITVGKPTGNVRDTGGVVAVGRAFVSTCAAIAATLIGILAATNVVTAIANFMTLMLAILVPWLAINLVDYYVVRKGRYVVSDFLRRDGGRYGLVNWWSIGIYIVAVGIEMLFVNASFYEGPVATALNGLDISWLVGIAIAGVGYWLASRMGYLLGIVGEEIAAAGPTVTEGAVAGDG